MGLLLWLAILLAVFFLDRCFVAQGGGKVKKQRKKAPSLARR